VPASEPLDDIRIKYLSLLPLFRQTASELQSDVERLLRSKGFAVANVESRAKDVSSFIKKILVKRYPNPWSDVTDKIGIRVTTVIPGDVTDVVDTVRNSHFGIIKIEDKRAQLDPTQLGYLATHIDAQFDPRNGLDASDCRFELQVRTSAESAWAYAAHDLMYKAPITNSPAWDRSTFRLLALVELFDCEVKRLKEEIMSEPIYAEGRVLSALEHEFFQLTAVDYNRELSRDVIGKLVPLMEDDELSAPAQVFGAFIHAHRSKFAQFYPQYAVDHRHILMSQPESILIFFLLEKDKFALGDAWQEVLPMSYLERLSEVWGIPVDLSDQG
jgi:ppGpp synthetase/RelA/SpoT-type nucleotidyltranferase